MSAPSIAPVSDEPNGPVIGEWVRVWGQVVESSTHPEDTVVEFFSHNQQWSGHVRTDRIEHGLDRPHFAIDCSALNRDKKGRYLRCELVHGHGTTHTNGSDVWTRPVGWIEDNA